MTLETDPAAPLRTARFCGCTADTELAMASGCGACGHRDHGRSGCGAALTSQVDAPSGPVRRGDYQPEKFDNAGRLRRDFQPQMYADDPSVCEDCHHPPAHHIPSAGCYCGCQERFSQADTTRAGRT